MEVAAGAGRTDLPAPQRGSRIHDVRQLPDPPGAEGVFAVTHTWTGGCALQSTGELILPCQGGHNAYYGNEIYALALRDATPAWQRIKNSASNAQISTSEHAINAPFITNLDGSPRTSHGWFHIFGTDLDQRIWLTFSDATPSGNWTSDCWSIARNQLSAGWTYHGRTFPTLHGGFLYQAGPGAYDRVANKIWKGAENSEQSPFCTAIDVRLALNAGQQPASGPAVPGSTQHGGRMNGMGNAWSAIPHRKANGSAFTQRCWIIGSPFFGHLQVLPVDNPGAGFTTKTTSGTPPPSFGSYRNAVYHQPSQAILVGGLSDGPNSDNRIWKLSIPDDPINGSYTWATINPAAGNSVTPTSPVPHHGTFGKFQLIEDMGNGQGALVFVTSVQGPAYVYKLPVTGV